MRSKRSSGLEDSKTTSKGSSNDPILAGTYPPLIESRGKNLARRPSSQPPQKHARHTLPAKEKIATARGLHPAQLASPTASPRFLQWLETKWESGFWHWLEIFWKSGFLQWLGTQFNEPGLLEWLETLWINKPGFLQWMETRWIEWQAQLGDQTLKLAKGSSSEKEFYDFTERASRRHKHKHNHYKERVLVLKKAYQVNVLVNGEVDGGCPGKRAWNTMVRHWVPEFLDLSVVEWEGQKRKALRQVRKELDREFEYRGYSVSREGFKNMIMRFMKTRVYQLKARYNGGKKDCPVNVQPNQWERLKKRWDTKAQWKKSKTMARAPSHVDKAGMEMQAKGGEGNQGLINQVEGLQCFEAKAPLEMLCQVTCQVGSRP